MSDSVYTHLPYVEFEQLLNLKGKTAVVTGGSDGIGFAISRRLAEAGATVVAGSRTPGKTEELFPKYPGMHVVCDVTKHEDIEHIFQKTKETYGTVDILVNNAGVYPLKPIFEITEEFWDRVYHINIKAQFFAAQTAGRYMIEQGTGGVILNLSSICGHRPMNNHVTYDSTKGAVLSMTRSLAKDLGQYNIRVNSISPGLTATPGNLDPELLAEHERMGTLEHIALKRRGEPYELASAALFLCAPISSYVTGTDLLVDGGWATTL